MRKYFLAIVLISFVSFFFVSCIKKAPLNSEADIESATIVDAEDNLQTDPTIGPTKVTFRLKRSSGDFHFAPTFILTSGASIQPASGTMLDFTTPQSYVVTSQDGQWKKTYEVSFVVDEGTNRIYTFENADLVNDHYDEFYDILSNGQKYYDWSSGNVGYDLLAQIMQINDPSLKITPSFYPTYQTDSGYVGKGVVLQTLGTGSLGTTFGSPLAAGNIYLGDFQLVFGNTLKSTRFGIPYPYTTAPKLLRGYFKYKAGDNFVVNHAPSRFTRDTWNAIGVLFENTPGRDNWITGDSTITDSRIVSIAEIDASQRIETNQWTHFEIPFQFVNGKTFDPNKQYMFYIVLTSSYEGDLFNGAIGSTLYADEIEWVTE